MKKNYISAVTQIELTKGKIAKIHRGTLDSFLF